jgi:Flp pilus assembly protein TadG
MTRHLLHAAARRLRDASGSTIVEAAIVTPLLLLLTFAIMDFGSLFYAYLALENGVSQATRYGVTGNVMNDPNNPGNQLSRTASMMLAMRQATPTLTIPDGAFTFSHLPSGTTTWLSGAGGPGDIEKLEINYTWTFVDPLMRPFFPTGQYNIIVDSSMKDESLFQ